MRRLSLSLFRQLEAELKLFWRNREALVLTLLVPVLGMVLLVYLDGEGMLERFFGFMARSLGAEDAFSDVSPMMFLSAGLIVYCVIAAAFENLTPRLVKMRDDGILKRLGGTPLRGWVLLTAKTLSACILVFIEVGLVLAIGIVASDITIEGSWWLLVAILLVGTFTLAGLGFALSSVTTSTGAAMVAVHGVYIPMLLLCGAFVPIEALPKTLQVVAKVLPLTYFVNPFRSVLVEGAGLAANGGDLLILLAWLAGGSVVAVKTFRWE